MKKRVIVNSDKEVEALRYAANCMDFGVSLSIAVAFNEMITAYITLRDNKRAFRHKVKQLANLADMKSEAVKTNILSVMQHKKFFDVYSDHVIDLAKEDISQFRDGIKNTLAKHGIKDADMLAQCETTRVLLKIATEHFKSVLEQTKAKFKCRIPYDFSEFNCESVFVTWDAMCEILYEGHNTVNLNVESCNDAFKKVVNKLINGIYIKECFELAEKECPDFTENDIKVIEDKDN